MAKGICMILQKQIGIKLISVIRTEIDIIKILAISVAYFIYSADYFDSSRVILQLETFLLYSYHFI